MACGLPVIATNAGGLKDILEDGRNGLVVTPGDLEQLHSVLDLLLIDSQFSAQLGDEALQTVQDHYTARAVNDRYIDLFMAVSNCKTFVLEAS